MPHDSSRYKAWYEKNAEKKRAAARAYYYQHRNHKLAYSRSYRERNPGCWISSSLKRNYGLTSDDVEKMRKSQNGKCAICFCEFDESKKALRANVDHDHQTGKVRGLLCHKCNISLGHFERPGFLEGALRYLGKT